MGSGVVVAGTPVISGFATGFGNMCLPTRHLGLDAVQPGGFAGTGSKAGWIQDR